jgi:AraC family transcriptional regulator
MKALLGKEYHYFLDDLVKIMFSCLDSATPKSLVLDFTKEDSSLQVLPSKPIVSSYKTNWNKIQIESHSLHAHEAPEHSAEQHVIIVFHESLRLVRRLLGNEVKDDRIKAGDVVVVPARVPHSACWDEGASFTLLSIEPKFLARIAHEFVNPDQMEILPYFSQPDPVIYEIVSMLKSKLEFDQEVDQMYVDSVATFLANHLIEHYSSRKYHIKEDTDSLSHNDLRQVIDYINAHLDQNLGLADLANLVGISYYHFARLFKKSTGLSPGRYLIECQLEKATHLLVSTNISIGEIAKRTGFSSHTHFGYTFRKHLSVTPNQYRQGY